MQIGVTLYPVEGHGVRIDSALGCAVGGLFVIVSGGEKGCWLSPRLVLKLDGGKSYCTQALTPAG